LRQLRSAALLAALLYSIAPVSQAEEAEEAVAVIQEGTTVAIEYTLKLDDGSTADSNVGRDPLVYTQGEGEILPALEKALEGAKPAETREVTLSAEEGYGPVRDEAFQTVPLEIIPEDARQEGARLVGRDATGNAVHARVAEVREDSALVDLNHPLAGKELHFTVRVVSVN